MGARKRAILPLSMGTHFLRHLALGFLGWGNILFWEFGSFIEINFGWDAILPLRSASISPRRVFVLLRILGDLSCLSLRFEILINFQKENVCFQTVQLKDKKIIWTPESEFRLVILYKSRVF